MVSWDLPCPQLGLISDLPQARKSFRRGEAGELCRTPPEGWTCSVLVLKNFRMYQRAQNIKFEGWAQYLHRAGVQKRKFWQFEGRRGGGGGR